MSALTYLYQVVQSWLCTVKEHALACSGLLLGVNYACVGHACSRTFYWLFKHFTVCMIRILDRNRRQCAFSLCSTVVFDIGCITLYRCDFPAILYSLDILSIF